MMVELIHLCCLILGVGLILNGWFLLRVLYPLRRLTFQATRLSEGDFAALEQPCGGIGEIDKLRRSLLGMSNHIRRMQTQRQEYIDALTDGQEAERERLAHELHDDTMQSLIAIGQSIDLANHWVEQNPAQALKMLQQARSHVTESVDNLRCLVADLLPPALEELGLVSALHMLAERAPQGAVKVEVEGPERRLSTHQELVLFRCAQEAFSNAQRHGYAANIHIKVIYQPDGMRLVVQDNGIGFRVPTQLNSLVFEGHYGLLGIQERVRQHNGKVQLNSVPGEGTCLEVYLPAPEKSQPADTVRDPVCSMLLHPHQAYSNVDYQGQRFYFCCPVCQGSFQRNPTLYLHREASFQNI